MKCLLLLSTAVIGLLVLDAIAPPWALADGTSPASKAADPAAGSRSGNKGATKQAETKPRAALIITPDREAAALTFVDRHHAELQALLDFLRQHQQEQYRKALAELYRASERLAQIRGRDSRRYELELELWKLKSRAKLMAARLTMSPDDLSLRSALKANLLQQIDLRQTMLRHELERQTARTKRIERQIDKLKQNREKYVERQIDGLLKSGRLKDKPQREKKKSTGSN